MNPKMNMTTLKCLQANETIVAHHMRHISMPINQTNEILFISCNNLLNERFQSQVAACFLYFSS